MSVSVDELARWVGRLDGDVKGMNSVKTDVAVLTVKVNDLTGETRSLKRAFYTLAVSVATSAVVFAFTVLTLL